MTAPVHATAADVGTMVDVLVAAFMDDPVQRWIFEPAAHLEAGVRAMFEVIVPDYFWLGHSYVAGDGRGAALWAPPDRHALREPAVIELLTAIEPHLGDETATRLGEVGRTSQYHPAEPHFYLGVLGVDPSAQGTGVGAQLIAPLLAECDRSGFLAHLESSNPRNISFYLRHGFEVTDEFRCGGDGPVLTIMTRRPR